MKLDQIYKRAKNNKIISTTEFIKSMNVMINKIK